MKIGTAVEVRYSESWRMLFYALGVDRFFCCCSYIVLVDCDHFMLQLYSAGWL